MSSIPSLLELAAKASLNKDCIKPVLDAYASYDIDVGFSADVDDFGEILAYITVRTRIGTLINHCTITICDLLYESYELWLNEIQHIQNCRFSECTCHQLILEV